MEQDAVVQAVLDGVTINGNVTAGMTAVDVAFTLYNAMVSAGVTGALLAGSDIIFLNNTTGVETIEASLTFTGSPGIATDWLQLGITIPQRSYL